MTFLEQSGQCWSNFQSSMHQFLAHIWHPDGAGFAPRWRRICVVRSSSSSCRWACAISALLPAMRSAQQVWRNHTDGQTSHYQHFNRINVSILAQACRLSSELGVGQLPRPGQGAGIDLRPQTSAFEPRHGSSRFRRTPFTLTGHTSPLRLRRKPRKLGVVLKVAIKRRATS